MAGETKEGKNRNSNDQRADVTELFDAEYVISGATKLTHI